MKINKVAFSYRRRFNLGNFESVEIDVSQWASVDEDEDADQVIVFLAEQCKAHVKASIPRGYTRQGVPPSYSAKNTVSGMEVI
jgi:hypothetical protein